MPGNNLISSPPAAPANALMGGAAQGGNPAGSEQQGQPGAAPGQPPNFKLIESALNKQAHIDALMRQALQIQGGPTRNDVVNIATEMIQQGLMPATKMAQYLSDLPKAPNDVKDWLTAHAKVIESGIQQAAVLLYGKGENPQPQPTMPPMTGDAQMPGTPA